MKRWIFSILILFASCSLWASAIKFEAKLSHDVVEVGQRFQVTFTVNSRGGSFTPPSFSGFRLLSGPNQSQSMQYVNGNVSRNTSISYVFAATEEGTYEIGPARIEVDGEIYQTKALEIKVVEASQNSANAQRNRQQSRRSNGDQLSDYVYIKAFVDKREVYVGEKVTATFKLYSKLGLNGINLEKLPALTGFWSQNLKTVYDQIQLSQEQIDGEIYNVAELQQSILYPQRPGELEVDPLEMKVSVNVRSRRSRSIFEQMFGSYERREVIVGSNTQKIKVKALPLSGKPADFSGAVGRFKMKLTTNKTAVKSNEAIDVKVEVSGQGNLPLIGAPELNFPPDFEIYDPETQNNYNTSYNGSKGSKVFNYLVIPRHAGDYEIEPFKFTYFDLNSKTYKVIESKPIRISVEKGSGEENVVYSSSRKEDVEMLSTDIRYIHINDLGLTLGSDLFYDSTLFYLCIIGSLGLGFILWFLARRRKEKKSDKVGLRKSKANKLAKKRLAKAKKHLDQGESRLFYEELSEAVYGYYADKYNINLAELSQDKILELVRSDQVIEGLAQALKEVLEQAEMARFAPSAVVDPKTLYMEAIELISQTENRKS